MHMLKKLGYNTHIDKAVDKKLLQNYKLARVVSVHRTKYVISIGEGNVFAELSGHFSYSSNSSVDIPTTGDWVYVDYSDDGSLAIIHQLVPRYTVLQRKTAGKEAKIQLIGANIDVAFIVQSVDFNLNIKRLERYLVMINENNIKPVILLSKCDLISDEKLEEINQKVLAIIPHAEIVTFSNLNGHNISKIKELLIPGQTYCLIGSSGVGKTTLLNSIIGEDKYHTQEVSKKENKGKHTTTKRELIQLDNGSVLIDTPGMRELGNVSVEDGLEETFEEISSLAKNCRFSNCAHITENNCAVLQALEDNEIEQDRYDNYIKIKQETKENQAPRHTRSKKSKAHTKQDKYAKKHKKY